MRFHFDPPENNALWIKNPSVFIDGAITPHTAPNCLRIAWGFGSSRTAYTTLAGLTAGRPYPVRCFVNFDGAGAFLGLRINITHPETDFTCSKQNFGPGWQLWEAGVYTPDQATCVFQFLGEDAPGHLGQVGVDDLAIGEALGFPVSKDREIRESLVARVANVLTGNGYDLSIGEVTNTPVLIPEGVTYFPHVEVLYGQVVKNLATLTPFGRKSVLSTYQIDVYCERTSTTDPISQCEDACAEIEKSLEEHDGSNFVGFPVYVKNVFVSQKKPAELPETIARDIRKWSLLVDITYSHDRRNP